MSWKSRPRMTYAMWGYMQTNKMLLLLIFESTMYIEYWRKDAEKLSQFSFIYLKSHILHLIANLPHIYYVHFRNKYHTHRKIFTKFFTRHIFLVVHISHNRFVGRFSFLFFLVVSHKIDFGIIQHVSSTFSIWLFFQFSWLYTTPSPPFTSIWGRFFFIL